jgi:hypothetical protein
VCLPHVAIPDSPYGVELEGSKIGGNIYAISSKIGKDANLKNIVVEGNVYMRGIRTNGCINLERAIIGGDVDLSHSKSEHLNLDFAKINGVLTIDKAIHPNISLYKVCAKNIRLQHSLTHFLDLGELTSDILIEGVTQKRKDSSSEVIISDARFKGTITLRNNQFDIFNIFCSDVGCIDFNNQKVRKLVLYESRISSIKKITSLNCESYTIDDRKGDVDKTHIPNIFREYLKQTAKRIYE